MLDKKVSIMYFPHHLTIPLLSSLGAGRLTAPLLFLVQFWLELLFILTGSISTIDSFKIPLINGLMLNSFA